MEYLIGMTLPYVAIVIFAIGAIYRIMTWLRAPKKLNWKLYPVPGGPAGEIQYILEEWISFKMLFKNNRTIWLGSYSFHLALVGLIVWFILFLVGIPLPWLVQICGIVMLGSCIYLLGVRLFVPQIRSLSTSVEYFNLLLFILICITGLSVVGRGLGEQARDYFLGLLSLSPISPPQNNMFLINLFLLEFLLAYFPFTKMFHIASKYFAFHKLRWTNPYGAAKNS